jgi:hypothetical protein
VASLILDLSHPADQVNDGVDRELSSLSYATVDEVTDHATGSGHIIAKCDIRQAYRNVSVHPEDRHLLGMQFEGKTYVDTALLFGLRSAPPSCLRH